MRSPFMYWLALALEVAAIGIMFGGIAVFYHHFSPPGLAAALTVMALAFVPLWGADRCRGGF